MQTLAKYPIVFCAGMLVALASTPLWRWVAPRIGFLDRPGARKIHQTPIPVGGGVAVFLGFHAACAVLFLWPWKAFSGQISALWWYRFAPLSCGVLLLGLLDDRFNLKPLVKLFGQILLALAAYGLEIRIQNVLGWQLAGWTDLVGTVLWFLLLMNAFNLIDGIDGLAAGIALIASLGIGVSLVFRELPGDVLLFLGLAGACLGFLRYNYYPATVFLGDAGSLFLGFTLAAMTISASSKGSAMATIGMPLLAVGVPVFDTALAIWRRSVRRLLGRRTLSGERIAVDRGDADHLHHRLLRRGRSHDEVAWLLYGATMVLALAGTLASVFHDKMLGILGLAFILTAYTVLRHLAWIELQDSGQVVLRGIAKPVRRNLTLIAYLVFDLVTLNLAWFASVLLIDLQDGGLAPGLKALWLRSVPVDVVLPFLALLASRSYTRLWSLARISEYVATAVAVLMGSAVACALRLLAVPAGSSPWPVLLHYTLMVGLSVPGIVGVRAALRVIQDLMRSPAVLASGRTTERPRALVWGIGPRTVLYLRQCAFGLDAEHAPLVVGIVSNDAAACGHYVHGAKILGTLRDLPSLIRDHRISTFFQVEPIDAADLAKVRSVLQGTGTRLVQWRIVEEELSTAAEDAAR